MISRPGVVALFLAVAGATAQDPIPPLKAGEPVERDIREGEIHEFGLTLQSAWFARGSLEQKGVAVNLTFYLPDGTRMWTAEGREGRTIRINVAGETTGVYRVKVAATKGSGRYRIAIERFEAFPDRLRSASLKEKYISPRVTKLEQDVAKGDSEAVRQFWREIKRGGAPLYEPNPKYPGQMLVTFLWRAVFETHNVLVAWQPYSSIHPQEYCMQHLGDTDVWFKTLDVPVGARFQYQLSPNDSLAIDSPDRSATNQMDPLNPNRRPDDPNMSKYRVFSVASLPGAPAQPWADVRPGVPAGKIEKMKIKSAILKNERGLSVYLPPRYDPNGPPNNLLIIFDESTHMDHVPVPTTLDNLLSEHRIPPTVAVLIDTLDFGTRERELNCNEQFLEFLVRELVPEVRKSFRVTDDPRRTIVGGLSYGGLAAAFAALRHSEIFGNVLSQSGTFWFASDRNPAGRWDNFAEPNWIAKQFVHGPRLPIRFFLDAGTFENDVSGFGGNNLETNRNLRDVLEAKGYEVYFKEFVGGHDRSCWRGLIADGLMALFGPVPVRP
jgi:enterochelin esterase-like enzyme